MSAPPQRSVRFRSIFMLIILLLLVVNGFVGWDSYTTMKTTVDDLWSDLSTEIVQKTTEHTLGFIKSATPFTLVSSRLVENGVLRVDDEDSMIDHLFAQLEADPNINWCAWGGEKDGKYLAAYRLEGLVRQTRRHQIGDGNASYSNQLLMDDEWVAVETKPRPYDPRGRPWYTTAQHWRNRGVWLSPYPFVSYAQGGFTYSRAQWDPSDPSRLLGVWAIDYECDYLSNFLADLKFGKNGKVYLVTPKGEIVGHPDRENALYVNGELQIDRADSHSDPLLKEAWTRVAGALAENGSARAEFLGHFAIAQRFPKETGVDWIVLMVAPDDDFLGPIRKRFWATIALSLGGLLIVALVLALVSIRTGRSVKRLAHSMAKIAEFDLEGASLDGFQSRITEMRHIGDAANRMRSGLSSFERYVPRMLVRKLIRTDRAAKLGGETADLTVMFVDVEGFTTISEELTEDELIKALGEYLQAINEEIEATEGTVDKYLGDAVMAFWGAPDPLPDHAERACSTALAIARRFEQLGRTRSREGLPVMKARLGVNSGTMFVGNVGSDMRLNYTVMGDAVNIASRLEGLNKRYGTHLMLGEETARRVEEKFALRYLDRVQLKGKSQAIDVFELLGPRGDGGAEKTAYDSYREGLERYQEGRFEEAARYFESGASAEDPPSLAMAELARILADNPPEDWDGVSRILVK